MAAPTKDAMYCRRTSAPRSPTYAIDTNIRAIRLVDTLERGHRLALLLVQSKVVHRTVLNLVMAAVAKAIDIRMEGR